MMKDRLVGYVQHLINAIIILRYSTSISWLNVSFQLRDKDTRFKYKLYHQKAKTNWSFGPATTGTGNNLERLLFWHSRYIGEDDI